jgi:hypothetical protein
MKSLATIRSFNRGPLAFNFATVKLTVRDAINSAMADEIERDPKVFLMGNRFNFQFIYR